MRVVRNAPSLVFLFVLAGAARADDAFLTYGGTPRLMSNHPSIRMGRERVVIDLKGRGYHVDATFEFRNDGPACSVRMGFPVQGYADGSDDKEGVLRRFRSWVDGRSVPTAFLRDAKDKDQATGWRVKAVAFRRGETKRVRVAYDASGDSQAKDGFLRKASYTLHTGASWHGPIGFAEVIVRAPSSVLKGRLRPMADDGVKSPDDLNWLRLPAGTIVWSGFAKPTVHERELRFVRSRFDPTKEDDVDLTYGFTAYRR